MTLTDTDLPDQAWCAGRGHAPHVVPARELEIVDGVPLCALCQLRTQPHRDNEP